MARALQREFNDKLSALTESQHSIEGCGDWMVAQEDHDQLVAIWATACNQEATPIKKKMAYVYVANDGIQKSRMKFGGKLADAFRGPVIQCMLQLGKDNPTFQPKLLRIVNVWVERKIYGSDHLDKLRAKLGGSASSPTSSASSPSASSPPAARTAPAAPAATSTTSVCHPPRSVTGQCQFTLTLECACVSQDSKVGSKRSAAALNAEAAAAETAETMSQLSADHRAIVQLFMSIDKDVDRAAKQEEKVPSMPEHADRIVLSSMYL